MLLINLAPQRPVWLKYSNNERGGLTVTHLYFFALSTTCIDVNDNFLYTYVTRQNTSNDGIIIYCILLHCFVKKKSRRKSIVLRYRNI